MLLEHNDLSDHSRSNKIITGCWGMVTPGTLKKERAQTGCLEKNGKRLRMEVASPANVTLQTWSAAPPHDIDEPNPGVSIVGFTVPVAAGQQVLVKVILTPGSVVGAAGN